MPIIAHLDMDAFFAAVEERENPRWRGKPVVVGADPNGGRGRGVVSTANYAAREYGIHSAMPIRQAWRLSETAIKQGKSPAIFLPGNFRLYGQVSEQVMKIIRQYSPTIEQGSIDEAYFDLTAAGSFEKAEKIVKEIKRAVKQQEHLTCSVGLGPNKLIAKIASGKNKPDGLTNVRPDEVLDFLAPLSIRELPGVGPKTGQRLAKQGVNYIRDLRRLSAEELLKKFGKYGEDLLQKAYGIGSTEIIGEYEAKSIGEQETFMEDTLNARYLHGRLIALAEQVISRFIRSEFQTFRTVVLTVRFSDFQTQTRSHTLKQPANELKLLNSETLKLLLPFLDRRANPKMKPIRLIGVRIEKLT